MSVSEEGGWAVIASLVVDLRLACRNAQRERERERGLKMEEKKGFNINQLWIVLVLNEDHSHRCWPLKRGDGLSLHHWLSI